MPLRITSHTAQIKDAMRAVIASYSSARAAERHAAHAELMRIFSILADDACTERSAAHRAILPALRHIEENYASSISAETLARLCMLSQSQMRRCFKAALGESPKAYQSRLLLQSAKNLLAMREFSIGEIADILGFYDIYAFSHFFTKKTGASPGKFLKG